MPGCKITSDTYGILMGQYKDAKTPIAVAGRVLVYTYKDRDKYQPGDAVCSAPNGTVDIMSREEISMFPDRIVGIVSEIPVYEEWYAGSEENPKPIEVNKRIWVYVRYMYGSGWVGYGERWEDIPSGCLRDSFGFPASPYALLVKTQLRLSPNRSRTFPVPFLYLSACLDVSSLYLPSSYLLPTFFLPSSYPPFCMYKKNISCYKCSL